MSKGERAKLTLTLNYDLDDLEEVGVDTSDDDTLRELASEDLHSYKRWTWEIERYNDEESAVVMAALGTARWRRNLPRPIRRWLHQITPERWRQDELDVVNTRAKEMAERINWVTEWEIERYNDEGTPT